MVGGVTCACCWFRFAALGCLIILRLWALGLILLVRDLDGSDGC